MHLILTGPTGLVGTAVLERMLANPAILKITLLSRRDVPMAAGHEDRVDVIIHKDYKRYDEEVLQRLRDAHGVVWAQGVSQMAVGKAEYKEITHDYPLSFARALSSFLHPSPVNFIYVSGEGATQSPTLFTQTYGIVKGQTEQALIDLMKEKPNLRVYNVRPGGVDWRSHPEIHSYMPKQGIWRGWGCAAVERFWKGMHTPTREMGKVMVELAMGEGRALEGEGVEMGGRLVTNVALRRMGGL